MADKQQRVFCVRDTNNRDGVSDDEVCENGLGFTLRPVNSEDREF